MRRKIRVSRDLLLQRFAPPWLRPVISLVIPVLGLVKDPTRALEWGLERLRARGIGRSLNHDTMMTYSSPATVAHRTWL